MSATRTYLGKSLLFLAIASFLAACGEYATPTNPSFTAAVKRESVWLVDNVTRQKIRLVSVREFGQDGNATSSIIYSETDNSHESSIFSYNDTVSIEEKKYIGADGVVAKQEKYEYVYDANGKIKNSRQYDANGKICHATEYDYDANGNVIKKEEVNYLSGKNTSIDITNRYTSNGSLSERIFTEGNSVTTRDSLSYLPDQRSVDVVNINSQGKIEQISSFLYDGSGRVREKRESDAAGNILKIYVYEYDFYK